MNLDNLKGGWDKYLNLLTQFTALQADAFRGAGLELTCFKQVDLKLPLHPAGVATFRSAHLTFLMDIGF
ncbi:hypothetical protein C4B60_13840 [Jeotgalibacillus proteolyticus]|uniref:Uncharacterized protein n=1 Tax=Jeotgalibacillus proteolyticus TaxID=2082395 RepID=A0A2S5G9M3_9BACL|nr:hypothetical protein C4B60_13840 [Jeotgalibacillus proteolyticus]